MLVAGGGSKEGARRGAANAQRLALALRQQWPNAPQTELEVEKIRKNLDVGLATMEALRFDECEWHRDSEAS